jgi:hypothetical protein
VQKAAEQVVREVIKEVHGPFFNSEVCGCVWDAMLLWKWAAGV